MGIFKYAALVGFSSLDVGNRVFSYDWYKLLNNSVLCFFWDGVYERVAMWWVVMCSFTMQISRSFNTEILHWITVKILDLNLFNLFHREKINKTREYMFRVIVIIMCVGSRRHI